MNGLDQETLAMLMEIRDLLQPISACFEERYKEIQQQRLSAKQETFRGMLTDVRRKIFPLLLDPRNLPQVEIARLAKTSQPTVSRFVNILVEQDLITELKSDDGQTKYEDTYNLRKELEA